MPPGPQGGAGGSQPFNDKVEALCRRLTDRRIDGSLAAAKGTAELLRQLVTSSRLNTPEVMLAEVKRVGLRIQAAKPIGACKGWRSVRECVGPAAGWTHAAAARAGLNPLPVPPPPPSLVTLQSWSSATSYGE